MTGSTRSSQGLDERRRRLLYRCWHRGTKETDLIMGPFADACIADMADDRACRFRNALRHAGPGDLRLGDRRKRRFRPSTTRRCSAGCVHFITTDDNRGLFSCGPSGSRTRPHPDQCGRRRRRARSSPIWRARSRPNPTRRRRACSSSAATGRGWRSSPAR